MRRQAGISTITVQQRCTMIAQRSGFFADVLIACYGKYKMQEIVQAEAELCLHIQEHQLASFAAFEILLFAPANGPGRHDHHGRGQRLWRVSPLSTSRCEVPSATVVGVRQSWEDAAILPLPCGLADFLCFSIPDSIFFGLLKEGFSVSSPRTCLPGTVALARQTTVGGGCALCGTAALFQCCIGGATPRRPTAAPRGLRLLGLCCRGP